MAQQADDIKLQGYIILNKGKNDEKRWNFDNRACPEVMNQVVHMIRFFPDDRCMSLYQDTEKLELNGLTSCDILKNQDESRSLDVECNVDDRFTLLCEIALDQDAKLRESLKCEECTLHYKLISQDKSMDDAAELALIKMIASNEDELVMHTKAKCCIEFLYALANIDERSPCSIIHENCPHGTLYDVKCTPKFHIYGALKSNYISYDYESLCDKCLKR